MWTISSILSCIWFLMDWHFVAYWFYVVLKMNYRCKYQLHYISQSPNQKLSTCRSSLTQVFRIVVLRGKIDWFKKPQNAVSFQLLRYPNSISAKTSGLIEPSKIPFNALFQVKAFSNDPLPDYCLELVLSEASHAKFFVSLGLARCLSSIFVITTGGIMSVKHPKDSLLLLEKVQG